MRLDSYVNFDGDCREAFEFYRSCFGGEFTAMMTFRDGPEDMQVPEGSLDRVMHASLPVGSSVLMGSDVVPGFGPPTTFGNSVSVFVQAGSREEADRVFAGLSDGATILMPLDDAFWGGYFGSLRDRFGVTWQVHHSLGGQ